MFYGEAEMSWIDETLERAQGIEELKSVSERLLRLPPEERGQTLEQLWEFTKSLEGEERMKFTVMAAILESADAVLRERGE